MPVVAQSQNNMGNEILGDYDVVVPNINRGLDEAGGRTAEAERGVVAQQLWGQLRHARLPWACRAPSGPRM